MEFDEAAWTSELRRRVTAEVTRLTPDACTETLARLRAAGLELTGDEVVTLARIAGAAFYDGFMQGAAWGYQDSTSEWVASTIEAHAGEDWWDRLLEDPE